MGLCKKCCSICGAIWLLLGLAFLLADLDVWTFWGINWWSAAFLMFGLCSWGKSKCKDCK